MIIENFVIQFDKFDKYSNIKKGITYYLANDIDRRKIMTTYKHLRKPIPSVIKSKHPNQELINLINSLNRSELLKIIPSAYKTSKLFVKEKAQLIKNKKTINLKMANILGMSLCYIPGYAKCLPPVLIPPSNTDKYIEQTPVTTQRVQYIFTEPELFTNVTDNKNILLVIIIILIILLISKLCYNEIRL
jgi:hypothetical protein